MKKLCTLLLVIFSCHAFAQQDSLKTYNANRVRITSTGMEVLGGWGMANIGVGTTGWTSSTDPQARYFHQMNVIWGSVDFVTAVLGYTGTQKYKNKKLSAAETLAAQERIQKIFRINSYLDMGYLGAGLYLTIAGNSRHSPIMKGYGESILLQGSFLLIFDELMLKAEKGNGNKLRNFLEKHPISFDGKRVGMRFNM